MNLKASVDLAESNNSRTLPVCPLCGEPCSVEDSITDAQDFAVHRECYREALISQRASL